MTPGPTNRLGVEAPLTDDPIALIVETCRAEGCLCDELNVTKLDVTPEMLEEKERRGVDRITNWNVEHELHCPLLAKQATN